MCKLPVVDRQYRLTFHCRTGSLEILPCKDLIESLTLSSLPYRQLRNSTERGDRWQMKKVHCRTGSLEMVSDFDYDQCIDDVHCRTGSLERYFHHSAWRVTVHCRTGSLEMHAQVADSISKVHCRTGSLEKNSHRSRRRLARVHCRTGSLERQLQSQWFAHLSGRSLPYRQLRKPRDTGGFRHSIDGSLPYRQLRN